MGSHMLLSRPTEPNPFDHRRRLLPPSRTPANSAAALLESCKSPWEIHAHVLRRQLLHSPFHWNALSRCYLRLSRPLAALRIFLLMSRSGAAPDSYSVPIALKSCSLLFALNAGRQLHCTALKLALHHDQFSESALISLYSKTGHFESARHLFDQNTERNLGSWNALINGLAQAGRSLDALVTFLRMMNSGVIPDDVTMVSVATSAGALGDLALAQQVHKCVLQVPRSSSSMLSNSLIDMYGKCGRTDLARRVFDRMPHRSVWSWTAMISGLATHGHEADALHFLDRMRSEGVRPNHVTMVGALLACAHGGFVDEGVAMLEGMAVEHGVEPTAAHYGCAVDMLGRVGRVEEARAVVEGMPMGANAVVLGTLLGACEKHGRVEIGEWAARKLVEVEPWNQVVYVVLSNIYAGARMWRDVERVRRLMRARRAAKTPGYSSADIAV